MFVWIQHSEAFRLTSVLFDTDIEAASDKAHFSLVLPEVVHHAGLKHIHMRRKDKMVRGSIGVNGGCMREPLRRRLGFEPWRCLHLPHLLFLFFWLVVCGYVWFFFFFVAYELYKAELNWWLYDVNRISR